MRRLAALLVLLLLAALPAAARPLTVAIPLEPPILDPTAGAAAAIDQVTFHTIFEELTTLGPDGAVQPMLASAWSASPDARTWTIRLRPGVRFSDGEPCNAAAVAFSLRRAGAPGSTNAQADRFANIARVDTPDPLTAIVRLRAPDAALPVLLSYGDSAIVPPRRAATLKTEPIGTGPFLFGDWARGDRLTLVRNPGYWGAPAHVRSVTFRFIVDPSAAFAAMRAHDVDLFVAYPAPETLGALAADPTLRVTSGPGPGKVILAFNQRVPALADLRVRRAIGLALDRRAIIEGAMSGYGTPIGSHFAPGSPDYVDLTGLSPHDPAAARRLLAQAGHAGDLSLTLALPPPPYARRTGEIVAAELAEVGIRVRIVPLQWAEWLDRVYKRHDFDLTVVNHVEPYDWDIYARPGYYFGYRSPAFNALSARLARTTDPAARHRLLTLVQRQLAVDAANAFLFDYPRLEVADARVRDAWANTPNQALDLARARTAGERGGPGGTRVVGAWLPAAAGLPALLLVAAATVRLGVRRLAGTAALLGGTLLVASLLIFLLVDVLPGDPAATMMGVDASPRAIAALDRELGLGGAAPARYGHWLAGIARGDLGTSYTYRVSVSGLVLGRLALSVPLALGATLLSLAIGVPLGLLAAWRRGRGLDHAVSWGARLGISVPAVWLGLLLILLFSVRFGWAAAGGFPGWSAGAGAVTGALILPAAALALPQAAILARVSRGALADVLGATFIRAARAKGLGTRRVLLRHALPNAAPPIVAVLGLQVPYLIAGTALVESVFFLPGAGRLLLDAVAQRDLPVIGGTALVLVAITVAASLAADLALAAIDPRVRG